jgi:hypothetical protein
VKRQNVDDLTCVFYNKVETCQHLYFDCVVASKIWKELVAALGINLEISNMHDITYLWNDKRKNKKCNMIFAAVLRTIWITRNDHVFNHAQWIGMHGMWRRLVCNCAQWRILLKEEEREGLTILLSKVESLARLPPLLLWPEPG